MNDYEILVDACGPEGLRDMSFGEFGSVYRERWRAQAAAADFECTEDMDTCPCVDCFDMR